MSTDFIPAVVSATSMNEQQIKSLVYNCKAAFNHWPNAVSARKLYLPPE